MITSVSTCHDRLPDQAAVARQDAPHRACVGLARGPQAARKPLRPPRKPQEAPRRVEHAGGAEHHARGQQEPERQTAAGTALTDVILATFRLNGRLLETAQGMAAEGDLTAAWWQVIGGVLDEPRSVADIGRRMGMTRQGVQRTADLLVNRGLAEYRPNPAHRRAKLLACTEAGYWAVRRISLAQHAWAERVGATVGTNELRAALDTMQRLTDVLEADGL